MQSLRETRLLIDNAMNETATSRLYYASFYAVNALLVSNGYNPKTHSGAKSLFNKEFILAHKIDSKFSDFYSFIMAKRFEADYEDFVFIDEKNIENLYEQTQAFVNAILQLMNKA